MIVDIGNITMAGPVLEYPSLAAYDPVWGYFTFGQTISMVYNERNVYRPQATFTIDGTFEYKAENLLGSLSLDPDTAPDAAFLHLASKYDALEFLFQNANKGESPLDPNDWYTGADTRCIQLPLPLTGAAGARILAVPESLTLLPSQMPLYVSYRAVLQEGKMPPAVLMLGAIPLEGAKISISPPRPVVYKHRMIAGEGSVVNVRNYTDTVVTISGVITKVAGTDLMSDRAHRLARDVTQGRVDVNLMEWQVAGTPSTLPLFVGLFVDSPTFEMRPSERGIAISLKGYVDGSA